MKIYRKRPDLFGILSQYVSKGDLVKEIMPSNQELDDATKMKYQEIFNKIKNLDLNVNDDMINQKILKYNGHLNLIVREILSETVV